MKGGERQKAELKGEGRKEKEGKEGGKGQGKKREKNRTTFSKLVFAISIAYCVLAP